MASSLIRAEYIQAGLAFKKDSKSHETGAAIFEMVIASLLFLVGKCHTIALVSKVPGKQYFTFTNGTVMARPANTQFFSSDIDEVRQLWQQWLDDTISPEDFAKLSYTCALAPCLAMEIFDRGNKKGPATQFEWFVGHLFSKAVDVNPTETVKLPVQGRQVTMTMDLLLDLGDQYRKVHLPVKMSTRERGVQAWSHQRLLDAAYGANVYRGILVAFSETKLDSRSLEVVEICVPSQWLAYQSLLAQLDRIYYFDVPHPYQLLTDQYPDVIAIKPFQDFFVEQETLLRSLTHL
jgi:hypothetical protein